MLSLTWSLPFVDTIVVFFPFSTWLLHIILTPVLTRQYPWSTCTNFENSLLMFLRNSLWRTGKVENRFSKDTVVPTSLAQGFLESSFPLWSYSSLVAAAWEEWCVTIESLLWRVKRTNWVIWRACGTWKKNSVVWQTTRFSFQMSLFLLMKQGKKLTWDQESLRAFPHTHSTGG